MANDQGNQGPTFSTMCVVLMTHHGYSEAALAEKIGVNQSTVHRYATGDSSPRYETGEKIVRMYRKIRSKAAVS